MMPRVMLAESPAMKRVARRPRHNFLLRHLPWQIQPFLLAPVLPGETLQNGLLQARVVTDPIKSKLIGWWIEYYFFYVKNRDLEARELLTEMMLNPEADLSSLDSATKVEHYHTNGTELGINWVDLCLERVTEEYFRNEGETYATGVVGNLPMVAAHGNGESFLDSAINLAAMDTLADETLTSTVAGQGDATTAVTVSEIDAAMNRWRLMRDANLTSQTYEQFLSTYGVRPRPEELHKPELLRYIRDWQYPSNTIDPTNGTARSAVSMVFVMIMVDLDYYYYHLKI